MCESTEKHSGARVSHDAPCAGRFFSQRLDPSRWLEVQYQHTGLGHLLDGGLNTFTPDPGILHAAIWHVIGAKRRNFVCQYRSDFNMPKGMKDFIHILGEHSSLESV